jgi:hypothetical protein
MSISMPALVYDFVERCLRMFSISCPMTCKLAPQLNSCDHPRRPDVTPANPCSYPLSSIAIESVCSASLRQDPTPASNDDEDDEEFQKELAALVDDDAPSDSGTGRYQGYSSNDDETGMYIPGRAVARRMPHTITHGASVDPQMHPATSQIACRRI